MAASPTFINFSEIINVLQKSLFLITVITAWTVGHGLQIANFNCRKLVGKGFFCENLRKEIGRAHV